MTDQHADATHEPTGSTGPDGPTVSTGSTETSGPERRAPRSWGTPNAALAVLLVVLAVLATVLVVRDPATGSAGAGGADAALVSARHRAVVAAAQDEATAFLTVDHRSTRVLGRRVLAGATGGFAKSYRAGLADLTRSARRSQASATPTLRAVGVGRLTATRATVLVAADAQVANRLTKGQEQARYYRLQLQLVRRDGRWLTSALKFVD